MRSFILAAVAVATLPACTTVRQQALAPQNAESLKGQSLAVSARAKPDFVAMTPGKAAFAILGAAAMISEGNAIVRNHGVSDPADTIAQNLAKALEGRHGVQLAGQPVSLKGDSLSDVVAGAQGQARYVLDAQTINWSLVYFPTDWSHYRVIYTARARLIDTQTQDVVAEASCSLVPEKQANSPTYDELLANQAARLKSELDQSASSCVQTMKSQMLAM